MPETPSMSLGKSYYGITHCETHAWYPNRINSAIVISKL